MVYFIKNTKAMHEQLYYLVKLKGGYLFPTASSNGLKQRGEFTVGKRVVEIVPIVVANMAVVIYVTTVECTYFRIRGSWKQEKSIFAGLLFLMFS